MLLNTGTSKTSDFWYIANTIREIRKPFVKKEEMSKTKKSRTRRRKSRKAKEQPKMACDKKAVADPFNFFKSCQDQHRNV